MFIISLHFWKSWTLFFLSKVFPLEVPLVEVFWADSFNFYLVINVFILASFFVWGGAAKEGLLNDSKVIVQSSPGGRGPERVARDHSLKRVYTRFRVFD